MYMNSRERIQRALNHEQTGCVPFDFGAGMQTGIMASTIYKIKKHYGLLEKGERIKITEPYQMLGEVDEKMRDFFGLDVVGRDTSRLQLHVLLRPRLGVARQDHPLQPATLGSPADLAADFVCRVCRGNQDEGVALSRTVGQPGFQGLAEHLRADDRRIRGGRGYGRQ